MVKSCDRCHYTVRLTNPVGLVESGVTEKKRYPVRKMNSPFVAVGQGIHQEGNDPLPVPGDRSVKVHVRGRLEAQSTGGDTENRARLHIELL